MLPAEARGEEGGWKLPNLNPFAKKPAQPVASPISNPPTSGLRWPRLFSNREAAKPKPNQPGTMQKMAAGTKSFFAKTADVLNPWDDASEKRQPPPAKLTGSGSIFSQASAKKAKEPESGGLLPTWPWKTKQVEEKPSVNDFLALPRPSY
jgi:hypothetical protein